MTSTPDREESLFAEALSRPKDQRTAFLEQACSDDDALRQRLTGLLAAHDAPETTLGIPVVQPIIRLDERLGTRIGPYLLLEKIGEGGCGTVFLAEQQEPVRRRVALKVIKLGMDSADVVARFEMERQALALMNHPNIANVLDAGATDTGRPYFVMELVVGTRITAYCDDHKLSLPERLGLFIQVCHAIQHAHQKGIIHRDIKPSNILVTVLDGVPVPKVIDFGIAKATQGQLADRTTLTALAQFIGTPVYMSPEQAELSGCDVDTRSDIYSLGVLLYELITGRPPFDPDSLLRAGLDEIRRHIREVDPPRPSTRLSTLTDADRATIALHRGTDVSRLSTLLRGDLDWIVMRCLEKERARRYDTANGLATDVQRYLNHEPVSASPPSTFYRTRKLVLRHKAFFAAAAVVTLALLAGTVVSTWQAVRATRAERLASARMLSEKTARQDADRQRQLAVDQSALATAARLDAEKQRKLAEERLRSETAARQDSERQKTVAEQERSRAQLAEKVAQAEALISQAVNDFLQKDLLLQADSRVQASAQQTPNPDLTVREALDRASGQVGARFSQQPLVEAGVREAIGQAYQGLGGSDKAAEHFERVLQIRKTELGPDHEHTFNAMHNLGTAYGRIQRLPEAASLLEQTLASRRRLSGPETLATLNTMNSLALVYWAQRRIPEAAALLKPVVEINQRTLGSDHPTSLTAAANLATLYHGLGQAAEAMALLESTLATKEQVLGKEHPDTLNSTNNLGCVYLSSGRPADAARLFTQVAEVRKRVLGPQHPDTLLSMCDLASAFRAQGLLDASAGLLEKTVTAQRQVLKSEHPDTLVSISNLAC
ncbi:MAG: tetratricopeptide repeat protein, partial [Verrucomicrobia bacterium]|nr:tetratricopeptide repeat protein [Verrucomicrobiota bacterium]